MKLECIFLDWTEYEKSFSFSFPLKEKKFFFLCSSLESDFQSLSFRRPQKKSLLCPFFPKKVFFFSLPINHRGEKKSSSTDRENNEWVGCSVFAAKIISLLQNFFLHVYKLAMSFCAEKKIALRKSLPKRNFFIDNPF